MYGCTYKYLDARCLTVDRSSNLTLTTQWRKRLTDIIQYIQN